MEKSNVFLLSILLMASLFSISHAFQLWGYAIDRVSIRGVVYCSLDGDPSAPPVFAGALAVQSNPAGGTVFLDRQRVGETPLQLTSVTAGAHVIWIESPGHARWTTAVQVNTNKLAKVSATLEPRR